MKKGDEVIFIGSPSPFDKDFTVGKKYLTHDMLYLPGDPSIIILWVKNDRGRYYSVEAKCFIEIPKNFDEIPKEDLEAFIKTIQI